MGIIRPATPGFLVTLIATGLLAVVSFCVPFFKSVYFLRATVKEGDVTGSIIFGTLGYCQEFSNGTTWCSKPSIGYELDINQLVDNNLPIQIPQVAVKWVTYALFSHVVALALAAGSAVFGLLAHVREMSMTYCSICISGFAAGVALIAFIFDLVLFFLAKARISAVGTATIGNAIWLTLAAWVLLFFSGCFYTMGRCCVRKRPKMGGRGWGEGQGTDPRFEPPKNGTYAEQMRLDSVKAEADRKARERQQKEIGLPAFSETQPLTARVEGDHVYLDDDSKDTISTNPPSPNLSRPSQNSLNSNRPKYAAGYVPGAQGNTAMDEYYNTGGSRTPAPNTYPPQPQRQASAHSYTPTAFANSPGYASPQRQPSGYTPSSTGPYNQAGYGAYQSTSPPPMPTSNLAVPGQPIGGYSDPYDPYNQSGQQYGHAAGGSSYHTAASHNQQPSGYSQYDPYRQANTSPPPPQQPPQQYFSPQPSNQYSEHPTFLASSTPDPFAASSHSQPAYPQALQPSYGAAAASPPPPHVQPSNSMHSVSSAYHQPQQRQYTVGGDGYGSTGSFANPYDGYTSQPGSVEAGGFVGQQSSPVRGPRPQPPPATIPEEEAPPPGYDQGGSTVVGNWGKR